MTLKKATLLAVIAISYNFIYRAIATIFPSLFCNFIIVGIAVSLSILAAFAILLFFTSFYRDYSQNSRLKKAAVFGIIASSALILVRIKVLMTIFDVSPYLSLIGYIEPIILLASSILILLFFAILYREIPHALEDKLKKATFLALIGSAISIFLLAMTVFNYLCNGSLMLFAGSHSIIMIMLIGFYSFGFFASFNFFVRFYRLQEQNCNSVIAPYGNLRE